MDTNKFFSFSRVAMVMKRDFMENWKRNLYGFIGLYAALALPMIGNMWGMSGDALSDPELFFQRYCSNISGTFILVIHICSFVYAADILSNMKTKEMRISFLMLPATMIEKYVARFLIVTVGVAIFTLVGMLLAEATRYIFLPLFDLPEAFHRSVLLKMVAVLGMDDGQVLHISHSIPYVYWLGDLCGLTAFAWTHSLYILGGSYWHKNAFLKTVGTLFLLLILGSVCMVQIGDWIGESAISNMVEWMEAHLQWVTLNKVLAMGVAFFSGLTLFNWWLAYRLFTRSQVVKPKFRLL